MTGGTCQGREWRDACQASAPWQWRRDTAGHWYGCGTNGAMDLHADDPVSRPDGARGTRLRGLGLRTYRWSGRRRAQTRIPMGGRGAYRRDRSIGRSWEWCANSFHVIPITGRQPTRNWHHAHHPETRSPCAAPVCTPSPSCAAVPSGCAPPPQRARCSPLAHAWCCRRARPPGNKAVVSDYRRMSAGSRIPVSRLARCRCGTCLAIRKFAGHGTPANDHRHASWTAPRPKPRMTPANAIRPARYAPWNIETRPSAACRGNAHAHAVFPTLADRRPRLWGRDTAGRSAAPMTSPLAAFFGGKRRPASRLACARCAPLYGERAPLFDNRLAHLIVTQPQRTVGKDVVDRRRKRHCPAAQCPGP